MASELADILKRVSALDHSVGDELRRQIDDLTKRRANGLNFERHLPEQVALIGRPLSIGDKVRFIPQRGATDVVSTATWVVTKLTGPKGKRVAEVHDSATEKTARRAVDDLVFVADFRDPIYPGLKSNGRVERGGHDKPFHTVINSENYHALEALLFTHAGQIDCIYIDPPYNSGAKDWKYNNDYVDGQDAYRHSKWLSFMERRLKLAKRLLNPLDSILIVTIDEKEFLRLGLLLEQIFPGCPIAMVTSVISAKGTARQRSFSRVEEHIFFVLVGEAAIVHGESNMLPSAEALGLAEDELSEADGDEVAPLVPIEWLGLRRREPSSKRGARPNQFYAIFVDEVTGRLHSIGAALDDSVDRHTVTVPQGAAALWPLDSKGRETLWGLTPDVLAKNWANGYARVSNWKAAKKTGTVQYLTSGTIAKIESGDIEVTGLSEDGHVQGFLRPDVEITQRPKRVWHLRSHNAETGGTNVLAKLIPDRRFDYCKSLYAVEDTVRFAVADKRDALVLDFFSGSGTTAHAVMRLNKQDGGRRRSISVTNNEVSVDEHKSLSQKSLRQGDPEWEALGICDYITRPRIQAAITGLTPAGELINGSSPMSVG